MLQALSSRHLTDVRKRWGLNQLMWVDILERFEKENDIAFAYNTLRIYQNQIEGKNALKPDKI